MQNNQHMSICAIHYHTGQKVEVEIENKTISAVEHVNHSHHEDLPFIAPGLIDLQINGYLGIDFNTLPIRTEEVRIVTKELWKQGVTTYFPTVITNSPQTIREALKSIYDATRKYPEVKEAIGGIHLEGPFISQENGPRGAHNQEYVQAPDWELFCSFQEAAGGKIKLVTLSPEWGGTVEFIKKCRKDNVFVAIGHTSATSKQIKEAVEAGASLSTHLGNGAHSVLPRHPNYIWDQLAEDRLASSFIADGFHLPNSVLKVILRMKGNKAFIVSDCVSCAGMEPGQYQSPIGGKVVLTSEGRLHMAEFPELLAGSAQTQLWGINHLLKEDLCDLSSAINLATVNPSNLLSLQAGKIAPGYPADLILFNQNKTKEIELLKTYKNGKLIYENKEAANRDHVSTAYDQLYGKSNSTYKTSS
jgi:N-acetylglucosamine-6-phosphate deacetylase